MQQFVDKAVKVMPQEAKLHIQEKKKNDEIQGYACYKLKWAFK